MAMDAFTANIGAEAIREMLAAIDLEAAPMQLREDLPSHGRTEAEEDHQAAEDRRGFIESGNRPEWMILTSSRSSRRNCARWCRSMVAASRRRTSTTSTAA
jgi:DNA-directed RNA polymerase beta' subunit